MLCFGASLCRLVATDGPNDVEASMMAAAARVKLSKEKNRIDFENDTQLMMCNTT